MSRGKGDGPSKAGGKVKNTRKFTVRLSQGDHENECRSREWDHIKSKFCAPLKSDLCTRTRKSH